MLYVEKYIIAAWILIKSTFSAKNAREVFAQSHDSMDRANVLMTSS